MIEHTDTGTVYRGTDGTIIAWDRRLTDREVRMVLTNPYQLLHPRRDSLRWWHRLARGLRLFLSHGRPTR